MPTRNILADKMVGATEANPAFFTGVINVGEWFAHNNFQRCALKVKISSFGLASNRNRNSVLKGDFPFDFLPTTIVGLFRFLSS